MLEVLKSLLPMILGVTFVFTAAVFASMAIKKKKDRGISIIGAIFIELISFTIWIPSFSDLFEALGMNEQVKQIGMVIAVCFVLILTVCATIINLKQNET